MFKLQVINHGMTEEVMKHIKNAAAKFFKLPLKEKSKYPFDPNTIEGYGKPYPITEDTTMDWSESVAFRLFPPRLRKLMLWPTTPPEFKYFLVTSSSLKILDALNIYFRA